MQTVMKVLGCVCYAILALIVGAFLLYFSVTLLLNPPAFLLALKSRYTTVPNSPPTFAGNSDQLKATQILASLDEPLTLGKNAIWCAAFTCAWKELQSSQFHTPLVLEGDPTQARLLNAADDYRSMIDSKEIYSVAGWTSQGITETIRAEVEKQFPGQPLPNLSPSATDALIAYARLETNVTFALPYFQHRSPVSFRDSTGKKTNITTFGIRAEDEYAYYMLRKQPRILFMLEETPREGGQTWEKRWEKMEFAIDLCAESSPNQIVLARVKPGKSMAEMIARIESLPPSGDGQQFGPRDVLSVPDIYWKISHHFTQLEGKTILNPQAKGLPIVCAQEDLIFRLDRNGAELKAEAQMRCFPLPNYFIFDRPFLLYIKKRGAKAPFFVMWVDNAELLTPWAAN